jgi:hypothetical protein
MAFWASSLLLLAKPKWCGRVFSYLVGLAMACGLIYAHTIIGIPISTNGLLLVGGVAISAHAILFACACYVTATTAIDSSEAFIRSHYVWVKHFGLPLGFIIVGFMRSSLQ